MGSIFDEATPIGGSSTAPPPLPGGTAPASVQTALAVLQKLMQSRQQNGGAPQQGGTPGAVGGAPPQMAGGQTQGQLPTPVPSPVRGGFQESPTASQFMSQLNPSGAAGFEAMQGISRVLEDNQARKDSKMHAEAANVAQNLMQAIQSGDQQTINTILNDPHDKKILDKVYKGWLTQAEKSKQGQEPADPAQTGFEAGIQQHVQKQGQPGAGGQNPNVVGGVRLPQMSPEQQLGKQVTLLQLQNALRQQQAIAEAPASPYTPEEQAKIAEAQAHTFEAVENFKKAQVEAQKAEAEARKAETEAQTAIAKGGVELETARANSEAARSRASAAASVAEAARYRAMYEAAKAKAGGKPSPQVQVKLDAFDQAVTMLNGIIDGKTPRTADNLTQAKNYFYAAGATKLGDQITDHWFWKSSKDDLKTLLGPIQSVRKGLEVGGQTPDQPEGGPPEVGVSVGVGDNPY